MIPVYYFDEIPPELPEDDACYIVSKHIYLKKRTGIIDSMVQVDTIDMGSVFPEYAHMNLPKIKAKTFGEILGFFGMVYGKHKSESGVILNLKTHPNNEKLKKIDYTVPHQRVSGGRCKYQIVVDPSYVNCGTIHSHCDFGAFHSGTDQNDERYFDGLHVTVGHVDRNEFSISACVVVNGKRVPVNPEDYIDGIEYTQTVLNTKFYIMSDRTHVTENEKYLKYVTPFFERKPIMQNTTTEGLFDYGEYKTRWDNQAMMIALQESDEKECTTVCDRCIFKEVKVSNMLDDLGFMEIEDDIDDDCIFGENDKDVFEKITAPIYRSGEQDADGIRREDNRITLQDYNEMKKKVLKKSIKCTCGSTFFVENPEVQNSCPNCEGIHDAKRFTYMDYLEIKNGGAYIEHEDWS